MAYTPQTWHDAPATDTPLSAARLAVMESGIQSAASTVNPQLDFTAVAAPAAPTSGVRLYTRTGNSGLDALAYQNNLGLPIVLGRDVCFFAKNISGSTITKGSVVYIQSASTSAVNIAKAQGDAGMAKLPAVGVVVADIANNTFGLVMQNGVIYNVNTGGMGDGSPVFVDPVTPGAFTATRPAHPLAAQMIGEVVNANATTGILLVTVTQHVPNLNQGTNQASWGIGDGTGSGAKSVLFKNSNTGTLSWQPTAARTLTLPDITGTLAATDANNNFSADALIPGLTSTVASASTVTLTVDSNEIQVFTGGTAQTVVLPTTGVVKGQRFTVVTTNNNVTTVQSSQPATIAQVSQSQHATFVALQDAPTAAAHWAYMMSPGIGFSSTVANSAVLQRTAQGNALANNFLPNLASIVTAAGTTALTNTAAHVQVFTGSTTQTLTLPTTSVAAGWAYKVINTSTGAITINASGGALVKTLAANTQSEITALQATPTLPAHWFAT